jgi:hypothetical protein
MRFAFALFTLLTVACSQHEQAPPPEEAPMTTPETNGYYLFSDGKVHPDSEGAATGLHVRGILDGDRFTPVGDVDGEGDLGGAGAPGWLELSDGSFHGEQTGRPPFPPYVEGAMTDNGFVPNTRTVNY